MQVSDALEGRIILSYKLKTPQTGAVGLEVAGEIVDAYKNKKVTVVDANAALLPEELGWHRSVGDRFEGLLKSAGVSVLHGVRVTAPAISAPETVEVTLSNGTTEKALYLAATGVQPRSDFLPKSVLTERGYVDTKPTFQSKSDPSIFAVGDASNNERKLALVIPNQVPILGNNLIKLMNGAPDSALQSYGGDSKTVMGLISFGKSAGGGQAGPIRFPSVSPASLSFATFWAVSQCHLCCSSLLASSKAKPSLLRKRPNCFNKEVHQWCWESDFPNLILISVARHT